jgi:hypothetical protein
MQGDKKNKWRRVPQWKIFWMRACKSGSIFGESVLEQARDEILQELSSNHEALHVRR